ncbi:MAG: hypothetical protein SGI92_27855, partial [Bryobacteraceae bacterium]|nr:hypothetical protein [Bryobacteraceae bacterium]
TGTSATVAADWMGADQVKGSFSTDLSDYVVVEVALYPKDGKSVDLTTIDFALRGDGRMIRPVDPRSIANIHQKRANKRGSDLVLYPTVGMSTGTWGTGGGVGVGVGQGRSRGPASTPRDRDVMEMELEEKALQDGQAAKPVAGYLYFPVGKKKAAGYDLEYQNGDTDVKLRLTGN